MNNKLIRTLENIDDRFIDEIMCESETKSKVTTLKKNRLLIISVAAVVALLLAIPFLSYALSDKEFFAGFWGNKDKQNSLLNEEILIEGIEPTALVLSVRNDSKFNSLFKPNRVSKSNHSYKANDYYINIEVLDAQIYTKDDILLQSQYKAEYFFDECLPDVNYKYAYVDWQKMQEDFPEFKEYVDSLKTTGFSSEEEYQKFLDENLEDYTTYMELDTKYIFVTLEITSESEDYKRLSLSENQIIFVNEDSEWALYDMTYCDATTGYPDYESRIENFACITLKSHETKIVTIGYVAMEYPNLNYKFSDSDKIYLFRQPHAVDSYDMTTCEPRICLNDFWE